MSRFKNKISFLFFVFAIACCSVLHAQRFSASVSSNTVGVGQQFEISFSINANASGFQPPSFDEFTVYSGPNESSSVEFVNGNVSQSLTYSYYLAPQKEGTFTIGSATINVGGKSYTSNPVTVKVVKGSPQQNTAQTQSPANNSTPQAAAPNTNIKKNLFIRIIPGKTKVYEGEELPVSIELYTRLNLQGLDNANFPEYNGFYSMDVGQKNTQITPHRENYNGIPYMVALLKQSILFPQQTGKLTIDAASVDCTVAEKVRSNNIFAQFFGGSYKDVKYTVKSNPVTITVLPLPETKKNFSGAVGNYSISGTLDKTDIKANEAVNLTVVISGSGNLKLIDSLPVQFPPDFDHYDPKITDHISTNASGVSGSRSFDYLFIPRHEGKYTIPAEEFTYFNPQKKSYVTLSVPQFNLNVGKGQGGSAVTVAEGVNKEDIKMLGQDIRYIHAGHTPAFVSNTYFLFSAPFYAGIIAPLLAFGLIVFSRRKYIEMNKDVVAVKRRGATHMAKKRLKTAFKNIAANNKEVFYEEIMKALNGYLSDKFTIPVSDLSRETITAKLSEKKVPPETLQKLMATLDNCEYARYAPSAVTGNLNEVYLSTVKLITLLEDEMA